MGITIAEFRVAMETYGANRLSDQKGSRYNILVPCFTVGDVKFIHSGSYYIVQREHKVPGEIMDKAMKEFCEKYPGGNNFWYGEIHSVRGILTLAAMIEGKYSKELIEELTNTTYKKLFNCSMVKSNVHFHFQSTHSPKMEKLCKKLAEYSDIVNPFGNGTFDLKEPIEYLNSLAITMESKSDYVDLGLINKSTKLHYERFSCKWLYSTWIPIQRNRKKGYISIGHYYNNNVPCPVDEIVRLDYNVGETISNHPNNIHLKISLKTGLAWVNDEEKQAAPVTDEQIDIMITYLNISIKKIKKSIIRNMIKKSA